MTEPGCIDPGCATPELRCDYAHVGLFDAVEWRQWIARSDLETDALSLAHAALLRGGSGGRSVPEKDRFLCYWYHTPHTGGGLVHGYPIEWEEGHLLVRLDPRWDHRNRALLRAADREEHRAAVPVGSADLRGVPGAGAERPAELALDRSASGGLDVLHRAVRAGVIRIARDPGGSVWMRPRHAGGYVCPAVRQDLL